MYINIYIYLSHSIVAAGYIYLYIYITLHRSCSAHSIVAGWFHAASAALGGNWGWVLGSRIQWGLSGGLVRVYTGFSEGLGSRVHDHDGDVLVAFRLHAALGVGMRY